MVVVRRSSERNNTVRQPLPLTMLNLWLYICGDISQTYENVVFFNIIRRLWCWLCLVVGSYYYCCLFCWYHLSVNACKSMSAGSIAYKPGGIAVEWCEWKHVSGGEGRKVKLDIRQTNSERNEDDCAKVGNVVSLSGTRKIWDTGWFHTVLVNLFYLITSLQRLTPV